MIFEVKKYHFKFTNNKNRKNSKIKYNKMEIKEEKLNMEILLKLSNEERFRNNIYSNFDVGSSGRGKRYINFEHLVQCKGLNGSIELADIKITRWQLEGLKDYINSNKSYKSFFKEIDLYKAIIVDSYEESDISL
jgi:hypothetical protein